MESLAKIFKFCTSNDSVEIKCEEDGDFVPAFCRGGSIATSRSPQLRRGMF